MRVLLALVLLSSIALGQKLQRRPEAQLQPISCRDYVITNRDLFTQAEIVEFDSDRLRTLHQLYLESFNERYIARVICVSRQTFQVYTLQLAGIQLRMAYNIADMRKRDTQ